MGRSFHASGPNNGKPSCGFCGPGVGIKRPCPEGYCPAIYVCKACWPAQEAKSNAYHVAAGCKEKHEHFQKLMADNPQYFGAKRARLVLAPEGA